MRLDVEALSPEVDRRIAVPTTDPVDLIGESIDRDTGIIGAIHPKTLRRVSCDEMLRLQSMTCERGLNHRVVRSTEFTEPDRNCSHTPLRSSSVSRNPRLRAIDQRTPGKLTSLQFICRTAKEKVYMPFPAPGISTHKKGQSRGRHEARQGFPHISAVHTVPEEHGQIPGQSGGELDREQQPLKSEPEQQSQSGRRLRSPVKSG
jgi:hypothetical protein